MNELEERETEGAREADEGVKGPVGGRENKTADLEVTHKRGKKITSVGEKSSLSLQFIYTCRGVMQQILASSEVRDTPLADRGTHVLRGASSRRST